MQDCLPKQLNQLCKVEGDNLNCQKLSLGALTPGKYTFELQVFPKKVKKLFRQRNPNQASDSVVTDTLAIAPIPIPQIARQRGLVASKSTYKKAQAEVVKLEWEITEIGKLQKLNVIRQGKDGKIDVYPYSIAENKKELIATNLGQRRDRLKCSVSGKETKKCQWTISSTDIVAGDSTFKVELFSSKDEEKPSDTLATKNTIAIVPVPLPAIEQFASARTIYKEGSESIKLNWSVKNPQQIEALIVKAISQNGSSQEVARYQYPSQTSKFCPTPKKAQDLLLCNNVSINSLPAGDYTFQLIVDPKQEQKEVEITQKTDTVKIESQLFEIVSFKVNGEEVKQGDTSLHARNKGIPVILDLAWSVKGNKDLKVEVLPLEGEQQASGSLQYTLPPETNRESITLRVTNQQGEQKNALYSSTSL